MLMEVMSATIMTLYNYHGHGGGVGGGSVVANGGYDGDEYDFI